MNMPPMLKRINVKTCFLFFLSLSENPHIFYDFTMQKAKEYELANLGFVLTSENLK